MTLAVDQPTITFEQFLALPDSGDYELVDGRLVERKTMGVFASFVATHISTLLNIYCREHKAGAVFGAETMYRCFGSPNTAVRSRPTASESSIRSRGRRSPTWRERPSSPSAA